MKTKLLLFKAALLLCLVATSCTKEQSELDLGSVNGSTTIAGQVTYNSGYYSYDEANNTSTYVVAAPNKTLYVDVNNSEYDSGASGKTRYTTTTDSEGYYSISIPCSASASPITAYISVASFTAKYSEMSGTELKFDIEATYSSSNNSATGYSADKTFKNIYISLPSSYSF